MRQLPAHPRDSVIRLQAILNTDGGARGNPGPAGIGIVLTDGHGAVLVEAAEPLGVATNNVAEYRALLAGLELALARGVTDIEVRMDSSLVISQVRGDWKIKSDSLRPLAVKARGLLNRFSSWHLQHVPRAENAAADRLANRAMDEAEVSDGARPGQGSLLDP